MARLMVAVLVVLSLFSGTALAQTKRFGDWTVTLAADGESMFAATINDSGDVLGEYCYFESAECNWILGMDTECKHGDTYVLLANSSNMAKALEVVCMDDLGDQTHVYAFNWKQLEAVIKGASWVGMAFPMQADAFKVVRFSLKGLENSTEYLEAAFLQNLEARGKQGTKTKIM